MVANVQVSPSGDRSLDRSVERSIPMNRTPAGVWYLMAAACFLVALFSRGVLEGLLGRSAGAEASIGVFTTLLFAGGAILVFRALGSTQVSRPASATKKHNLVVYCVVGVAVAVASFIGALFLRH